MSNSSSRGRVLVLGVIAALTVPTIGIAAGMASAQTGKLSRPTATGTSWRHHKPPPTTTTTTTTPPPSSTSTTPSSTSTSSSSSTTPSSTSSSSSSSTTTPSGTFPQPSGVVYADHVAQWNVICGSDHFLADDPIVFPGAPGASHMHTFYANTSTNASTTLSSLSASSPSTCGRGMGTSDLSAYWVPSLMKKNADGTLSTYKGEQTATIYYKRPGEGRGPGVLPFPKGLRMIAGNAKATSDQSLSVIAWDCGRGGLESPHMYQCAGGSSQPMVANVIFPSCWDGVHLDSADHKSHMAYAASNGACPSDHPVSLPEVSLEIEFVGLGGGPDYSLASGGIYSMHADFFADWDNQVQNALVVSCLNGARECADMNRNGSTLFRPDYDPEPITINLNNFSKASPWDGYNLQEAPAASPTTTSMAAMGH